jgi:hypothetical protein
MLGNNNTLNIHCRSRDESEVKLKYRCPEEDGRQRNVGLGTGLFGGRIAVLMIVSESCVFLQSNTFKVLLHA